jgi:hypothetical protein
MEMILLQYHPKIKKHKTTKNGNITNTNRNSIIR